MKDKRMRTRIRWGEGLARSIAALTVPWLFTSCASSAVVLGVVGPRPPVIHATGGEGDLVVYSATEPKRLDKGPPFYGEMVGWRAFAENHSRHSTNSP